MLAFGEVQTGLLQNSRAVTGLRAAEVVNLVNGEQVRRLERPIAYAVSPDRPDGVDCRLPHGDNRGTNAPCGHRYAARGHLERSSLDGAENGGGPGLHNHRSERTRPRTGFRTGPCQGSSTAKKHEDA